MAYEGLAMAVKRRREERLGCERYRRGGVGVVEG